MASLSLTSTVFAPGQTITVKGTAYGTSRTYTISIDGVAVASGQTTSAGTFSKDVVLPTTTGAHSLKASSTSGTSTVEFTIVAASAPTGPVGEIEPRYILIPKSQFDALPTTGAAYTEMLARANSAWPAVNYNDQDNMTNTLALAAAMVFARTGNATLKTKARNALMAAIATFSPTVNPGLAAIRQTAAWVFVADFIDLAGADDTTFRAFLNTLKTGRIGTHSRWGDSIKATHDDSYNNWGGWAGCARIAIDLYLDDAVDLAAAADTLRGFFGDRTSWDQFHGQKDPAEATIASWACDGAQAGFTPVNGVCTKSGINVDGAVCADISRDNVSVSWPPPLKGIMYTHETIAGTMLQAELLYRHGHPDIYTFQSNALKRMGQLITRSGAAGGPGWNPGIVQWHIPFLLNKRYGAGTFPVVALAKNGRSLGYTDWLYA